MNGYQFIAHLMGKLVPDDEKIRAARAEAREKFPAADLIISGDLLAVTVHAKQDADGTVHCMKCGNPMTSRTNQYFKDGKWVEKARKDNFSNYECPTCATGQGSQPIGACWETAKDVTEQDLKKGGETDV